MANMNKRITEALKRDDVKSVFVEYVDGSSYHVKEAARPVKLAEIAEEAYRKFLVSQRASMQEALQEALKRDHVMQFDDLPPRPYVNTAWARAIAGKLVADGHVYLCGGWIYHDGQPILDHRDMRQHVYKCFAIKVDLATSAAVLEILGQTVS